MYFSLLLKDRFPAFVALCKEHKVRSIYAFGSAVTNHFDPQKSDIDLIVELAIEDPIECGETLLSLWDELELFFQRKVDLLTEESIHNPYLKKSIDSTKKLIYDGQREEVFV